MRSFERALNNYNPTSKLIQDHFVKKPKKSLSREKKPKPVNDSHLLPQEHQQPYLFPSGQIIQNHIDSLNSTQNQNASIESF